MAYTPMIEQYLKIKNENNDSILFFRLGDFYEMFFEDAIECSRILEIALTEKECGSGQKAPMCGVPYHSVNGYINKLIEKGYKVAICEQLTDPNESKGIVERGIVRIVTPGTLIGDELRDEKSNNYVLCAYKDIQGYYISLCDISTGKFLYNEFSGKNAFNSMIREIIGYAPNELLLVRESFLDEGLSLSINKTYIDLENYAIYKELFANNLNGDLSISKGAITVCGMLFSYLLKTQKNSLNHISKAEKILSHSYMEIDNNAKKHLELFETLSKEKQGSLFYLMDKTNTSMGGRMLRGWLNHPLISINDINDRQNAVGAIVDNPVASIELKNLLSKVYDIERIVSKLAYKSLNPHDCLSLKKSLKQLPDIKSQISTLKGKIFNNITDNLDTMEDVYELLEKAINPDAPFSIKDGDIINPDFNPELKELYSLSNNSKDLLLLLENREREETGIKNLKLGYNKVFGYYLEVTKSYFDKVPYRYIRKQTLANCERYITEELKEVENKISNATEKRIRLEQSIFESIRNILSEQISRFQKVSDCIGQIDSINSLGTIARDYGYVRPSMTNDGVIKIEQGKHPIVERVVKDSFIANDTYLDSDKETFAIITGPNMAGKSTYMRQIALITIMAHIGSFVPAKSALIPITSKLFTRIGALDNLSKGKSTFMVEMSELADIIDNADKDSLIILDEIGRGTSTIDGVSIALAAVKYITTKIGAKTLFATHYHQLSNLEGEIDGVVNYKVAVSENNGEVVFLHSIKRGGTDKSFGIYVAKLAGLPNDFIAMAQNIMKSQTDDDFNPNISASDTAYVNDEQIEYKENYENLKHELMQADLNNITPMEAMMFLTKLQSELKEI